MNEIYTVYVLYSDAFNKHYTGFTGRLEARIQSHNDISGKGYTKKYRPWRLIYQKEFETKSDAMAHEKWLKTGVGRDFIMTIQH
jgi:putative endonuclease